MHATGLLPRTGSNTNIVSLNGQNGVWLQSIPSPGFKKLYTRGSPIAEPGFCTRLHRTVTGRRMGMLLAALVSLFSFFMLINIASRISVHFISPSGLELINSWAVDVDKESDLEVINTDKVGASVETVLEVTDGGGDQEKVSEMSDAWKDGDDTTAGTDETDTMSDKETNLETSKSGWIDGVQSEARSIHVTTMASRLLSEGLASEANIIPETHSLSLKNYSSFPRFPLSSDQPLPPGHPCQGFTLPPPPADKKRTGPRPCPVCYLPVEEAIKKMPCSNISTPSVVKDLSYVVEALDPLSQGVFQSLDFGGHPSLEERSKSFRIQEHMNVYCGFVRGTKPGVGTGFDIDKKDLEDMDKCTGIVVASAIFGNYDLLQQPRNISPYSRKTICFFMFVDEETQQSLNEFSSDNESRVWRIVVVHNMPYADARRNGKIPKLLLHRLFPNAQFSLWIDGKLQLVVDPYQVLERFLWRQNQSFAISQHYKRLDVFEEAEANKAAGKYDNTSIDTQINFYRKEGIRHYDTSTSPFRSDVPEGCVIIREHTPITNLFTCLWFNEVDRFTSRDQLSFAIVRNKLTERVPWRLNMFLDCERRNFVVQMYHKELLQQKKFFSQISETNMKRPISNDQPKSFGAVLQHTKRISLSRKARKHRRGGTA